jgi:hypothetical protein
LLEVGVLADFHAVAPHLPAETPGADGGVFPIILDEADVVQRKVDANRRQRLQIERLHVAGVGFQDHLVLMKLAQAIGIVAMAAIGRPAGGLDVGGPPGLGS